MLLLIITFKPSSYLLSNNNLWATHNLNYFRTELICHNRNGLFLKHKMWIKNISNLVSLDWKWMLYKSPSCGSNKSIFLPGQQQIAVHWGKKKGFQDGGWNKKKEEGRHRGCRRHLNTKQANQEDPGSSSSVDRVF